MTLRFPINAIMEILLPIRATVLSDSILKILMNEKISVEVFCMSSMMTSTVQHKNRMRERSIRVLPFVIDCVLLSRFCAQILPKSSQQSVIISSNCF